jgi:hypothetical protein
MPAAVELERRPKISTGIDPGKFATHGAFGFREKPEASIRPDLSADLLHAAARVVRSAYVGCLRAAVMVLTKGEAPCRSLSDQGACRQERCL